MTYLASFNLGGGNVNPSPSGAELDWTRRLVDFTDLSWGRLCYGGGGLLGDCAMGVSFSTDLGTTWSPLIPPGPPLGVANMLVATPWVPIQDLAPMTDVWVSCRAYGAAVLGGLLYTVKFLDLQLR